MQLSEEEKARYAKAMNLGMIFTVIILGVFVYFELDNQNRIMELLERCNVKELCSNCIPPLELPIELPQ